MPVPFGGVIGGLYNSDESLARVRAENAQSAQREFALGQEQLNADIMAKSRAAMMEAIAKQQQGGMGAAMPTPGDLAESELGGSQPATMLSTMGTKPALKLSDLHRKEASNETEFAKAAGGVGDLKGNLEHAKLAEAALAKATAAQKEERIAEQAERDKLNNMISAPFDEASLNNTIQNIRTEFPDKNVPRMLAQMGFERNPDGRYPWSPTNEKKLEALQQQTLTQEQRERIKDRREEAARRVQRDAELEQGRQEDRAQRSRSEQLHREAMQGTAAVRAAEMERKQDKDRQTFTNQVQRTLDKDPIYANYARYETAKDLGEEVKQVLQKGGEFDATQARALATKFQNISEDFRARTGGKYALQDVASFNGLYDKFNKWVGSIGKGTPTISRVVAADMANTVTQLYDIVNKNVVIASMEGVEKASRRGNPEDIRVKGNVQRLFNTGQAKEVREGGKTFWIIGTGDNAARFEMTAPRE